MNNGRIDLRIPKDHSDLAALCNATKTSISEVRDTLCNDGKIAYEGNYIRVKGLKYWEDSDIQSLKETITRVNAHTVEYQFEFDGVCDYEVEYDNDRSWPASFSIKSFKKS